MLCIHKLDRSKGLDLILHTPGGSGAATESLVNYLHQMFGNDIRAFVPQLAMSAGTILACSCKEIYMGKHSNLGLVDPQAIIGLLLTFWASSSNILFEWQGFPAHPAHRSQNARSLATLCWIYSGEGVWNAVTFWLLSISGILRVRCRERCSRALGTSLGNAIFRENMAAGPCLSACRIKYIYTGKTSTGRGSNLS